MNHILGTTQVGIENSSSKENKITELISHTIQSSLDSFWNNWASEHRVFGFLFSHPLLTTFLLVAFILTIWSFIQIIPRLWVNFWLKVFKSPFILGKSLLKSNIDDSETNIIHTDSVNLKNNNEYLDKISRQLEIILEHQLRIEKEQKKILTRLKLLEKEKGSQWDAKNNCTENKTVKTK